MTSAILHTAIALIACALSQACVAQSYSVIDLGMPVNGDAACGWDITEQGTVFGTVHLDGHRRSACFIHQNGALTLLHAEFNMPFIWAGAINHINGTDGLIGTCMNPFPVEHREPFVTALDSIPDTFPLFPGQALSGAADINHAQPPWAVGHLNMPETIGIGNFPVHHAFRVLVDGQPNPAIDIGTLGGPYSRAEAINDSMDIVGGTLSLTGPMRGFLWRNITGIQMISLGTLGGPTSQARDVNNSRQVVGWSRTADGGTRAFLWQNSIMTSLGTLGGEYSEANGINAGGDVVGMSFDAEARPRAFLHRGGRMIDLNQHIAPGSGWKLQFAQAINTAGQIVGWGRRDGQTRAFRLTPIDTPADLNSDGVVNGIDLGILLAGWSLPPRSPGCAGSQPCPADLNGDDVVNGVDLGILLAGWTPAS